MRDNNNNINNDDDATTTTGRDDAKKAPPAIARFVYYSQSADAPPGRGTSEWTGGGDTDSGSQVRYALLRSTTHWRRMLSNFHPSRFTLDGRSYCSVEHAFHTHKLTYSRKHTIDSAHAATAAIMHEPGKLKRSTNRSNLKLDRNELRRWDQEKTDIMRRAMLAKFSQNEDLKRVLLATEDAELYHHVMRSKETDGSGAILMRVRDILRRAEIDAGHSAAAKEVV